MKAWRNEAIRLASEGQSAGQTLKKILEDNEIYDKKEFDGLTYEKAYEKMRNFLKRQRRKWEHQQGYTCERALMCFVWNMDKGKRETWITNF